MMYVIFISNIAAFYTYYTYKYFYIGEIKTKQKNKICLIEGSKSKPSTYENDALTARPFKY